MPLHKKILSVCVAIGLAVSQCGCLYSSVTRFPKDNPPNPDAYLSEFQSNWSYLCLNDKLQTCYGSLYTALTDGFSKDENIVFSEKQPKETNIGIRVALPHSLQNQEEAQKLYSAFINDNPHFFYISNTFALEGYEQNGVAYYDKILLAYTMDAAARTYAEQQLRSTLQTILEKAPETTDDFKTELYLHEQLTARCTYDDGTAAANSFDYNPNAYTAYGALIEGKAVCEGYSRAMQLLLKNVGIPSTLVIGESISSDEQHMWNMVTINGRNYHLDVTWNDSSDETRHNYFNITTNQVSVSHRITQDQLGIDTCTATDDNYYVRNGLYLDTYHRQEIAAVIAERLRNGDQQIELFFAPDKFDSALLFLKSRSTTESMVNACLSEYGLTLWEYTLYGETDEHILCIRKK